MTTVQYVVAVGLALFVFVGMANLVVDLYARGVVRAAVDEGARAGGRFGAGALVCEERASRVLDDLLGGALRVRVKVTCANGTPGDPVVIARGEASLPGWVPALAPEWRFTVEARAYDESGP